MTHIALSNPNIACSAGVFWVGESLLIGSPRWSRHLWFYDRGRLGRVEIVTLSIGVRVKKGDGGGGGRLFFSLFLFFLPAPSTLPLTHPISSSLQKVSKWRFQEQKKLARPKETPSLQAKNRVENRVLQDWFLDNFTYTLSCNTTRHKRLNARNKTNCSYKANVSSRTSISSFISLSMVSNAYSKCKQTVYINNSMSIL